MKKIVGGKRLLEERGRPMRMAILKEEDRRRWWDKWKEKGGIWKKIEMEKMERTQPQICFIPRNNPNKKTVRIVFPIPAYISCL